MWKEVQRTRKKEVLSGHFVLFSHVSYSRQSVSKSHGIRKIELKQRNRGRRQAEKIKNLKNYSMHEKKARLPNCNNNICLVSLLAAKSLPFLKY